MIDHLPTLYVHTAGAGPEVVLAHGWGMHSGVWENVAEALIDDCRVTVVDLPGHGYSRGFGAGLTLAEAQSRFWALGRQGLFVEDDPSLLRLYRVRLARWPMHPHVTTAANGFEGLVRIGSERPDLLIADLSLPEMDGFQMLRTIRAMPELDATEIVVVSGLDAAAVEAKGGLPEGIPVLTKPIPFGELERIALRVATQAGRFVPAGT